MPRRTKKNFCKLYIRSLVENNIYKGNKITRAAQIGERRNKLESLQYWSCFWKSKFKIHSTFCILNKDIRKLWTKFQAVKTIIYNVGHQIIVFPFKVYEQLKRRFLVSNSMFEFVGKIVCTSLNGDLK